MAIGLPGATGSFIVNASVLGGIVTGSSGEFIALPMSSSELMSPNLAAMDHNEWSRFYLSDSFGAASGSVIQALNYLSASLNASSGDVTGPGSSTDNAIVRFDGTTGKIIQNTSVTTITDAGNIVTEGSVSGASTLAGISLAMGNNENEFTVSRLGRVQGGTGGNLYDLRADGFISGASSVHGNNLLVQSASVALEISGGTLAIGGDEFTVNASGLVEGGAAGGTYKLRADGLISGTSAIQGNSLFAQSASLALTVVAGTNVSGAGLIQGQALTIGNAVVVSDANALGNVTTISGASSLAGAKLTINGADIITQAGAVAAVTTVSGAGALQGQNLSVATTVSGAGQLQGGSLQVGAGAGSISVDGAFVGSSFQGQSFQGSTFKASSGHISGAVDTSVQFSNTGSAGGNNYKAAMLISSSDIQGAGDAALIPRMVMQGTNDAGALTDFMISVSGGLLQVVELTYGNALPI
jgi:hypothetical protein